MTDFWSILDEGVDDDIALSARSGRGESFWGLASSPPAPPGLREVVDAMRETAWEVDHRRRLEAVEELCRMAYRDGHGVFLVKSQGIVVEGYVATYVPAGQMYVYDAPSGLI